MISLRVAQEVQAKECEKETHSARASAKHRAEKRTAL